MVSYELLMLTEKLTGRTKRLIGFIKDDMNDHAIKEASVVSEILGSIQNELEKEKEECAAKVEDTGLNTTTNSPKL